MAATTLAPTLPEITTINALAPNLHPTLLEAVKRMRAAEAANRVGLEDVAKIFDKCALDLKLEIAEIPPHTREGIKAAVEAWLLNCDATKDMDQGLIAAGRALAAIADRERTRAIEVASKT